MRKMFAFIFKLTANTIAALCAALFVLTAVLVFLLLNVKHSLLNAETYKRALIASNVYEQFPALVSEQLSIVGEFLADPCAANPLGCSIDGASPELQTCLIEILGEEAYVEIGSGQRNATDAELEDSQACLDQWRRGATASQPGPESGALDENLLINASAEVQDCVKQALGDETYETLSKAQRQPTETETQQINTCFDQTRDSSQPNRPQVAGPMVFLNNLTSEQWQALILHLLPPDDLQYMIEATLDQAFAYFNGETNTAKIPLDKFKARLTGKAGEDLILFLLNAQPPCTEEQLSQVNARDLGEEGKSPVLCATSGETLDKLMTELQRQLTEAVSTIPVEAVFIKPPSSSDPSSGNGPLGKDPQTALRWIHWGLNLSPLLPLALLLLVTLFGVRSRKGWLLWWGIPIFIVGLITLSIGVAAKPLFEWAWVKFAVAKIPVLFSTSDLPVIGHDIVRFAIKDLSKWIMIEASLISLLGLGAMIFSSRAGQKTEQTAPPTPFLEEKNEESG